MFVAQAATTGLEPAAIDLLTIQLNRPDLTSLTTQLNDKLGDRWAYTGSVALQLHSMDRIGMPGRDPVDVDFEVNCQSYDLLRDGLRSNPPGSAMTVAVDPAGKRLEYYFFNNNLKVDLLNARPTDVARPDRRTAICGVPVLTLDVLKARKEDDLDSHIPAIVTKAILDLEHIALLQAGNAAPAAALPPPLPVEASRVRRTLAF